MFRCAVPRRGAALSFLFVDLELGRDERFYAMAARRDGEERLWESVRFEVAHRELVEWLRPDDVLVGHNLHRFDRPAIASRASDSPLLQLPTLDTLELSVLSHPGRPYHKLTKDDRLVRDARPNPISDVRASEVVLRDALAVLAELPDSERDLLRALLTRIPLEPTALRGWQHLFEQLGSAWEPLSIDLAQAWRGRVCTNAPLLREPPADLGLVMLAAWLRVASRNDGSVLPGWVRRTWPETSSRIRALRATHCHDPACDWCAVNLCPEHWLREVFGYPGFRDEPTAPDGGSLQRLLVERGLRGLSTFGILPTGGGKSLCFQVPAEARHRLLGQLTVVISPLQSLMKDQVDGLQHRISHARAIYSGLPALLRPQVLEEVRTGECGLLYLSPEQFRNASILRLLKSREIGAIVFDEAHCLSQWGHDFRTDYPYVLKAVRRIAEDEGLPCPPVFLFTATAQYDATQQILEHVEKQTGTRPELFDGGSARHNLTYVVRQVPEAQRLDVVIELLQEHLGNGSAIVFCGSRGRTEGFAQALTSMGFEAVPYHAGLDADRRREVQNDFLAGRHRIITATNAFGMGVDKSDVRLVLHIDMPSSLEAYLQEAGRAGRDGKPATAVLLWSPGDAEARFSLGARSDLSTEDLDATWRAVSKLPADRDRGVERRVITARELLFQEALIGRFDPYDPGEETRVKAAVNWLEFGRVLERRENITRVFSGRPVQPDLVTARARIEELDLPPDGKAQWHKVLEKIYEAGDEGLSADHIAVLCKAMSYTEPLEGGRHVLSILEKMTEARLLTAGQTFSAFVSHGVADSSLRRLERWAAWEQQVLERAESDLDDSGVVHPQAIADHLSTDEVRCLDRDVMKLLRTWSKAGQGQSREARPVEFQYRRGHTARLLIHVDFHTLRGWLHVRRAIAAKALGALVNLTTGTGKQLLVSSELEHLVRKVEEDFSLRSSLQHVSDAVRGAVAWMNELQVITIQNGLAIFRSAMRLDRQPDWPNPGEARDAKALLRQHQEHKILGVHVMDAWAQKMLDDPEAAERFRADWFALPAKEFVSRWFPRQKQQVQRPTTPESYHAIVTSLSDPVQQQIVTRAVGRNHLVLAGPGSGKTRILVHRVAWLLRCRRVRPRQILVVCYTRANAIELRRRLHALVGQDATRVRIHTLHGVAMRMVGPHRLRPDGDLTLETCIPAAAAMLRGESLDSAEQSRQRDALLRGIHYLFIDEYQDIDSAKYELLSAIAGRAMSGDQRKLRVFAVGDDDQAIFSWDGSSTDFIRSFEQDYYAERFVVPHNYRNPKAVLEMAQELIVGLPDRLKADTTLTVDPARTGDPPMGPWAHAHPELLGRIPWRCHGSVRTAAYEAMATISRWLDDDVKPSSLGVLTRTRKGLHRLRTAAEALEVRFTWPLPGDASIPVGRIREVVSVFELLDRAEPSVPSSVIERHLDALGTGPWAQALRDWLEPNQGRLISREAWRYDLLQWTRLERQARTLGEGVHLGTMHSAKGLEFDHVLLLDDGTMKDTPEERRLLYVALTRARHSLQIFSPAEPSPIFRALRHPLLDVREAPLLAADVPVHHDYDLVGREDIWIDWLGQQDPGHPGHRSLAEARTGEAFTLREQGSALFVVDAQGHEVARLSKKGCERWAPRLAQGLKLRLIASIRERAADVWRTEAYRERLKVESWWTGVWEARWRAG